MYSKLKEVFDLVGVIDVSRYDNYLNHPEFNNIKSIFVVGLAYPSIVFKHKEEQYLASIYTYGLDYHKIIKDLALKVIGNEKATILVDSHQIDERKCLALTGLAYRGKNDLMINKDYGSYFFIGLVLTENLYPEVITINNDSCGDCIICLKACPMKALENGFQIDKCLSSLNQIKKPLSAKAIKKNYLLMGCDICQLVCPKNKNLKEITHNYTKTLPTAYIEVADLFNLTNQQFNHKYNNHAYLWRGKTILLRNALTLLLKYKNTSYNNKIKETILNSDYPDWYKKDALIILEKLKSLENQQ